MSLDYPINVYGLRRKVFNHTVAKTYLKLKEISQLRTYDEGYQRQRDKEHEDEIIDYLKNSSNRYLPDIIIAIRHQDMNFGDTCFLNNHYFYIRKILAYKILRISFEEEQSLNHIKIIDGNHRVSAIKRFLDENPTSELGDFEIGVTFILSNDEESDLENEMALFYYLNSKSKPLLPNDYLSETTQNLSDEKAKEIDWWLYIFKKSYDRISKIFEGKLDPYELQDAISYTCDYIATKIPKDDFEILPNFMGNLSDIIDKNSLNDILESFLNMESLDDFLNILFFLDLMFQDKEKTIQEFIYFYDWLVNHAKLTEFSCFESLYQTYQEVYVPQDYKIFVAMEFANQDDVFSAIKGTIDKVKHEMDLPLECIRIDKVLTGNTYQIMDEILMQIQHNRLLIADLTNKNANVYLEVGYAMGLAKTQGIENQIMFFVKDEGVKPDVGFDLQSYQYNGYQNTEELRSKLETQLKAYYSKPIKSIMSR